MEREIRLRRPSCHAVMDIEVVEYDWWGQENAPPPSLKTTKQLAELGLAPVAPVGVISTSKYDLKLYDPANERSVRQKRKATPAQLAALQKGRDRAGFNRALAEWREYEGFILEDRISVVRWAKEVYREPGCWRVLDIETTGLDDRDRIVEIAVVDLAGTPLLNTLIRPTGEWFMSPDAAAVHGIGVRELEIAPTFAEIYPELANALRGCRVLTYGADFDARMIAGELSRAELPPLLDEHCWHCLMHRYAMWYGEWSDHWNDYRWQALGGAHRALGDSLSALTRLREMAESSDQFTYPQWLIEQGLAVGVDLGSEKRM